MQSVVEGTSRDKRENDRLNEQHELVKAAMAGKLLLCPVDLTLPHLRVLDSGTAQANWILDVAGLSAVASTASLFGTDVAPEHFPPPEELPGNVKLFKQSIFETWPVEMQSSFDVVHQRFVLAACKGESQAEAQGADAVAKLFGLVKPGGWIELHEGNMVTVREGPQHAAMMRFRDVFVQAWKKLGQIPDPGVYIGQWLRDAGAVDIYEEVQVIKIGAAAEKKEDGDRGQIVCLSLLGAIKNMVGGTHLLSSPVVLRSC